MKKILLFILLSLSAFAQNWPYPGMSNYGGGGGAPTVLNSGCDFASGSTSFTTSWSPTSGNTLIVMVGSAAATAFTLADSEGTGNTYTVDGDVTGSGFTERGRLFRAANISGSGAYTITATGATTPGWCVIEVTGNRTLDTVSVGTNPSVLQQASSGNFAPGTFTTTTANVLLVDGFFSLTSSTITIAQTDASFTTISSCTTGLTCFVGAGGYRVVSATGSYSDGWTLGTGSSDKVGFFAAYK